MEQPELEDPGVIAIARAISAGTPIDWPSLESSAKDDSMRAILRELRVIAGIAELNRSLPPVSDSGAGALASSVSLGETTVAPSPAESVLATWGSLKLLAKVGEGSFGDVYHAWDTRLDRDVALKLLRRADAAPETASTVIQEGRLLARVRHPNVVTVHGADRIDGRVGLWMEFIHGRTLERVLRDHGPFGAQEAALIGLDLVRALSAVHSAGLLHRDIKAHNVMRAEGGRVVLMDFGAGLDNAQDAAAGLSGTPLYLAPELFAGAPASVQSDLYSVGVLLYHLVTGSYPVKGRSVSDVRRAHQRGERTRLRDARPDLPDRFVQAIESALDPEPARRPASAGALEAALTESIAPRAVISEPHPEATRAAETHSPRALVPSRTWVLAAIAGLLAIVSLAVPGLRSRLLGGTGGSGGSRQPHAAAADVVSSEAVVRRVTFPKDYLIVGRPSPDGRFFSYVDGNGDLALVELATGKTRQITNKGSSTEMASMGMPFSSDGNWIAYAWNALDGAHELRLVRTDGKDPRVLVRRADIERPVPYEWSVDNTQVLALVARRDRTNDMALVRVADGHVRVLKNLGSNWPQSMSLSGDGRFVVYDLPQRADGPERDVHVVDVASGREWPLVEHASNDLYPLWAPDGEGVVFISERSLGMSAFRVPVSDGRAAGEPVLIQRNLGRVTPKGITRSGAFFYHTQIGMVDVYTADVDFAANRAGTPKAVSSGVVGSNLAPHWSPDGRYLAFVTTRGLIFADRYSRTLSIRDMQTGVHRELTPPIGFFIAPRWSPDGGTIAVKGRDLEGRYGTHLVDVATGRVRPAVLVGHPNEEMDYGGYRWAPDGHFLYEHAPRGVVSRNLASGAESLLLAYADVGVKRLNGFTAFHVSPDGRSLAFSGSVRDGDTLTTVLKVQPLGGAPTELAREKMPQAVVLEGWTPDSKEVLFVRYSGNPDEPVTLSRVSIAGGEPRSLGLSMSGLRNVSVHPDGTQLTFTAGGASWEVWVMEKALQAAPQ